MSIGKLENNLKHPYMCVIIALKVCEGERRQEEVIEKYLKK